MVPGDVAYMVAARRDVQGQLAELAREIAAAKRALQDAGAQLDGLKRDQSQAARVWPRLLPLSLSCSLLPHTLAPFCTAFHASLGPKCYPFYSRRTTLTGGPPALVCHRRWTARRRSRSARSASARRRPRSWRTW